MTIALLRIHPKGLEVSDLVLGTWRSLRHEDTKDPKHFARLISGAIELGMTSFDCADIYRDYPAVYKQRLARACPSRPRRRLDH